MNNQNLTKCTATLSMLLSLFFLYACGSDSGQAADSLRNPVTHSVSGIIEKGPFGQGSKVTLYELRKDLSQTGKSFKTQTTSHLGAFKIDGIELESPYVEMETNGYFYNEVKGEMSVAPITLNAIADITNRNSVNVNIITHLEFERVKKLVKDGSSFSSAKAQAEKELLKCFGITEEISNPENISITDNNRNASILLAISTIMLYNRSEGDFTAFMSKFATDFADNGVIDDLSVRNGIKEGQENVHPSEVANKMKEYYGKQNVAVYCEDFSKYIDFNGDGVIDGNDKESSDMNEKPNIPVSIEDNLIASEEQVRSVASAMYASLAEFIQYQKVLECARVGMGGNDVNPSSPDDRTLWSAWSAAYKAISEADRLISGLKQTDWATYYYAEALALRSFAYYQLAVLWGNVPVATSFKEYNEPFHQLKQEDVLSFVLNDLQTVKDRFGSHEPWGQPEQHFNSYNVRVLLAEVLLTLQQRSQALQYLPTTDFYDYSLFIGGEIYSYQSMELIAKEANGDTEELATGWLSPYKYGTWAVLKRLGVAQEVASCNDYELLLPIPLPELAANANIRQNPGY